MFADANKYHMAIDGGASKTEICVFDPVTKSESHFFSGCSNYKNPESDTKKAIIDDGIGRAFSEMKIEPAQIKGLVMGLSGCDSQKDHDYFMSIADLSGVQREKIYICNDCELPFFSNGKPPGLSVVAGTGSIVTGFTKDFSKARSGGWGSAISDEGSGGWMGLYVIRDLLRYFDGYGEYQLIFDIIREHLGESAFDSLPGIFSQSSLQEIAGYARLVMAQADKGDGYCCAVTASAAELVAEIAWSVYKKLGFPDERSVDVVLSGSLFYSPLFSDTFRSSMTARLSGNNLNFCGEVSSPVMGGIALSCSMFS